MSSKYEEAKECLYSALFELCDEKEELYARVCSGEVDYPCPEAEAIHDLAIKLSAKE